MVQGAEVELRPDQIRAWRGSVDRVFRVRRQLVEYLAHDYVDRVLGANKFTAFLNDLSDGIRKFGRVRLDPEALRYSLLGMPGQRLDKKLLHATCWRMAGNLHHLAAGIRAPPWVRQRWPEFCPVQIIRMQPSRLPRSDEPGWLLRLQVLGGTPCPRTTDKFWSRQRLDHYARNDFGFSRSRGRNEVLYPFNHATELVTLRFLALFEPQLSDDKPRFHRFAFTPSLRSYNLEQHRYRARHDDEHACPERYDHECHQCHVGYRRCRAGVHALDYEFRFCERCGRADAAFDPEFPNHTLCVNCFRAWQARPRA